jgi:hypothetical protein
MRRFHSTISFRALSVLALAMVAVVLLSAASPGATGFLTKRRAKQLFYTKPQSDQRFVNVEELTVEGWHLVGAAGQPAFTTDATCDPGACWENFGSVHNPVGFYKDTDGVVHLKGIARCNGALNCEPAPNATAVIFNLPAEYHPAAQEAVAALSSVTGNVARMDVTAGGQVVLRSPIVAQNGWVSLDGITFRADS